MSLTFPSGEDKKSFWHTTAHMMAAAVKRLYPDTKLTIGPPIEEGFYYDFDSDHAFTPEDLKKIEAEMKKIMKSKFKMEYFELPRDEAIAFLKEKDEPYKIEIVNDLPEDATISFYRTGEFEDLCGGPHIEHTGQVRAFKLLHTAGAYWRGDQKNKMLQRIYGISFPTKDELKEYLVRIEEAKKRDHNKLGRELGYFTTVDTIGQGLPLLLPKGAKLYQILTRFVEDKEEELGYLQTKTPLMAKSDLYKISGHWDHYRDGMFILGDPEDESKECLALRPMTCPFQYQAYLTKTRSYKDLPIRYNETSTLFRNESSGEMHGLIRLRQFTISEAHMITTPDKLESEFSDALELANYMLKAVGLYEDVSYRFSKWDPDNTEKYIGSAEEWERVQDLMRDILDNKNLEYTEETGEAAFYGPKLDIQIKNVFGKEDTLITVQIDFQLAKQFGMVYVDADGEKKHPYIVHRTSIGCYERTMALLIEKYAGALPMWLSPEQIRILPISEKHIDGCREYLQELKAKGLRVTLDVRDEKIGKKIREAQMEKIPYMLIVGDKELEDKTVSVRSYKAGEQGAVAFDTFMEQAVEHDSSKRLD